MSKTYKEYLPVYGTYFISYATGFLLAGLGKHIAAGTVLMLEALFLYGYQVRKTGNLMDLKALFSVSWVGGEGIACLQLSNLQKDWSQVTWICFFAIYVSFCIGYDLSIRYRKSEEMELCPNRTQADHLFLCIMGLMAISVFCFILEAAVVGFVPIFSDKPHAYSYFHVSGVHYFTISCILIPAITVLLVKVSDTLSMKRKIWIAVANVVSVMVPILCVSRFQLLFAVGFAVVIYIIVYKKIRWKTVLLLLAVMVPVYVILTVFRHHDVTYLNGIFEPKYDTPIFITQPYMYVANNFENFNCMVEQLQVHTHGLKMLFPLFALSGLKFVFPQLVELPVYLTKPELTTLTMFYDAYYDFGIAGIILFALLVGACAGQLTNAVKRSSNPIAYLFYGQFAIYLGLAFFTTWFSNPTTWFWFVLTGVMYVFVGKWKWHR